MLRYVTHSEIDFNRWDACVQNSSEHLIYAYSGYLEVSTNKKWDAVIEFSGKEYVSVFPLPYKILAGTRYTYQPIHSQQLGLFTTVHSEIKDPAAYLALIPETYRKIYLQLNAGNTAFVTNLPEELSVKARLTFHLNLSMPYETLYSNYSSNLRRNLKKASQHTYQVTTSESLTDIITLFRQTRGKLLKDVKDRHYNLIEKQYVFLKKNGLAEVLEMRENGNLVAGALFLVQPATFILLFSAVSEAGRKNGAMPFLLDWFIQKNAATSKILDFEGGTINNMRQFYSSFGAKSVTYLSVSKNSLPWYLKWLLK